MSMVTDLGKERQKRMKETQELYNRIVAAWVGALDGRDPDSVDAPSLLPAIFSAVPEATVEDIIAALRSAAQRNFARADALEAYDKARSATRETP
jgi:hypothetical protein